jgi:hypothetical protein
VARRATRIPLGLRSEQGDHRRRTAGPVRLARTIAGSELLVPGFRVGYRPALAGVLTTASTTVQARRVSVRAGSLVLRGPDDATFTL